MREMMKKEPVKVVVIIKSLLVAYILTGIMLLILAMMVFKMNLKQGSVEIGILIIYIAAAFAGGFLAGKMGKNKKFIWGLISGAGYVLILLAVSFCVNGGIQGELGSCITTLVMCMGAGMLGGMVS